MKDSIQFFNAIVLQYSYYYICIVHLILKGEASKSKSFITRISKCNKLIPSFIPEEQ